MMYLKPGQIAGFLVGNLGSIIYLGDQVAAKKTSASQFNKYPLNLHRVAANLSCRLG